MDLLLYLSLLFIGLENDNAGFNTNANSTTYTYTVYLKSDKIGKLTVSKTINGADIKYTLNSDVTFSMIFDYMIVEHIDESFKDDKLQSSQHTRHINKEQKVNNKAQRVKTCYKLYCDNKARDSLKQWITQTALTLYFKMPKDKEMIYSQNFQKLVAIKKLKSEVFELNLPDGKKTTYRYASNKLKSVASGSLLGTIKFVLD